MNRFIYKTKKQTRRKASVRKNVTGCAEKPRLTVFRSAQHIYAQLIDDVNRKTLASSSDIKIVKGKKIDKALEVGKQLAEAAKKANVKQAVFDRNGYKFHGRVKAIADGFKESGLKV